MRLAAATLALLALAACPGKKPEPPGETVGTAWTAKSSDAAIAMIQTAIERRRESKEIDTSKPDWRSGHVPLRPKATFDPKKTYLWNLDTSEGRLRVRLHAQEAPEHVSSLVYLTLLGFHDALPFYEVRAGKGVLGGCPVGDGSGSPGYVLANSPEGKPKHDRAGLLSAVSLGAGTDDSKFRLTLGADPSLDEHCTVYGEVVDGMDVLKRLGALGTDGGKPSKAVLVRGATITIR